jgi:hypothetical protein
MDWSVGIFDASGAAITGASALTTLRIRRVADNFLYDFNDSTFKNAGWVAPTQTATEVSAVNLPGIYVWVTAEAAWNDGDYQGIVKYAGTPAMNESMLGHVRDGKDIDVRIGDVVEAMDVRLPSDPADESLLEAAITAAGVALTPQQVRDAAKLAPTAGAPAAGSIDAHLDTVDGKLPTNYIMGSSVAADMDDEIGAIKGQTDLLRFTGNDVKATLDGEMVRVDATSVDLIWDEALTGATHNVPTSAGRRLRQVTADLIHDGLARAAGSTSNTIQLDVAASGLNGAYDPSMIAIVNGTGAGQCRLIYQYDGATQTAAVDRSWRLIPDDTSEFVIWGHPGREHVNEGLARAGGANTVQLNTNASSAADEYVGQLVFIRSGTGEDQVRVVTDYDGVTKVATVNAPWTVVPDTTSAYVMIPNRIPSATDMTSAVSAALASYDAATGADVSGIPAATDVVLTAAHGAGAWDGVSVPLNAQQTRDAMKLAPSVGAPAAGSIDTLLGSIDGKTTNLPADPADQSAVEAAITASQGVVTGAIAGLNDLSALDAQAANAAALVAYGAATGADVAAVPAATDVVLALAHGAGAWDGLTPPQTLRDAMTLAPTPGVPGIGSVDALLIAIDGKTTNLPADPADQSAVEAAITASQGVVTGAIGGLENISTGDVETAVGTALTTYDAATATDVSGIPAATDGVLTLAHGAGSWTSGVSLTQQQVRDAAKLAPTVGVPAAGSIDAHLDAIDGKTTNLPSDPADQSAVEAAVTAATAPLATSLALGVVDGIVDGIKLQTDLFRFTGNDVKATLDGEAVAVASIAANAVDASALATDAVAEITAATDVTLTASHGAGLWAGGTALTMQQVRDAAKLAPTVGVPAAGSVDAHLDAIDGKTANLPADPADQSLVAAAILASEGVVVGEIDASEIAITGTIGASETAIRADIAAVAGQITLTQADLAIVRQVEVGKWKIIGTQMVFYEVDESTPLLTFDLFDDAGLPNAQTVFERRPV